MPHWCESLQPKRPSNVAFAAAAATGFSLAVAGIAVARSRRRTAAEEEFSAGSRASRPASTGESRDDSTAHVVAEVSTSNDVQEAGQVLGQQLPSTAALTPAEVAPQSGAEAAESQNNLDQLQPATVSGNAENRADRPVAENQEGSSRERLMGLRTLLSSLQACDRVCPDSIMGPFQMNAGTDEVPVVCFQFRMSHFTCKVFLAHGTQDEGSQHLKLQTTFEDNRRSLGEEQRYFIANEWNATKRYTRLKCGSGGTSRSSVFTLEYDVLVPADTPHTWGSLLLAQTLRMWYTSMVACVMHIVEPRDVPFATHEIIQNNTLAMVVEEDDTCLQCQSCPICFENFKVGEHVRRLPCMHLFHLVTADDTSQSHHCNIDKHLVRDKQCPVCKTPVDFMERSQDKNSDKPPSGEKVFEGEAFGMPASSNTASNGASENISDVAATVTTNLADLGETGVSQAAAAVATADATNPGSDSMAAVARGAAAHGLAAAAEVAAVVARLAPQQAQAQADGLPAQAAELERAVRSLQSRWMQIQDVVAGMQQMLQYIEENQTMITAARAEQQQQQNGAEAPSNGPEAAVAQTPDGSSQQVAESTTVATATVAAEEAAIVSQEQVDSSQVIAGDTEEAAQSPTPSPTDGAAEIVHSETSQAPDAAEAQVTIGASESGADENSDRVEVIADLTGSNSDSAEITMVGHACPDHVQASDEAVTEEVPEDILAYSDDGSVEPAEGAAEQGEGEARDDTAAEHEWQPTHVSAHDAVQNEVISTNTPSQQTAAEPSQQAATEARVAEMEATRNQLRMIEAARGQVRQAVQMIETARGATPPGSQQAAQHGAQAVAQVGVIIPQQPAVASTDVQRRQATDQAAEQQARQENDASAANTGAGRTMATSAEASVMLGLMQAMQLRGASGRPSSGPTNRERWQPFTEAEKLCMAYMWRQRRAQQEKEGGSASS